MILADPGLIVPVLHYVYPAVVFCYFMSLSAIETFALRHVKYPERFNPKERTKKAAAGMLLFFIATYVLQLTAMFLRAVTTHNWGVDDDAVIGRLSCILIFGVLLSRWIGTPNPSCDQLQGSVMIGLFFEVALIVAAGATQNLIVHSLYDGLDIVMAVLRIVLLGSFLGWTAAQRFSKTPALDQETESLLPKIGDENGATTTYGATQRPQTADDDAEDSAWERRQKVQRQAMEKRLKEHENWFEYAKGFSVLLPYVWPFGSAALQLRAIGVILCILATNALHLLIPRQTGIIMDSFTGHAATSPWVAVGVYAALRIASSECGVQLLQQWFWLPVKYYAHETLARAAFSHIMHLSADFHDSKSSSDILMAIHGGSAISNALESIFLSAFPMLVDMGVAVVYLSIKFGPYEGLVTVATGIIFLHCASRLVEQSKIISRKRRNAHYREYQIRHTGLTGWQTVSAFNQIGFEENRHADAVTNRWAKEKQYVLGWQVSMAFQTMLLTVGLLASAVIAVFQIQNGQATSGEFAMLLMYWAQLTSPLQFFAKLGKNMSDDLIDAERLLDVMKTKPSVDNKPGARPFKYGTGNVEFSNVVFSYDKQKMVINDMSLSVKGGEKIAFVGATGAGKSTLLKLLFRFYDTKSGTVSIDGQDVRDVDLFSLRDRIGMVPQNPTLFDDTVLNNVRYAKMTASDEEVYEACRAACIHDKILSFTNGYNTKVGERGVKLSGGELQRVAIARAILKRPDIVLLDEATSAVDTDTEQQIQQSFEGLCQGRTTFIVAHRLSTIKNADRIVVVENGSILEQGTHQDLLAAGGRYAYLWSKQGFDICEAPASKAGAPVVDIEISLPLATVVKHGLKTSTPKTSQGLSTDDEARNSKLNPIAAEFTPRTGAQVVTSGPETLEARTKSVKVDGGADSSDGN
ncbi:hypothetical protein VHEMI03130 [[Torrubiella] hemipterigena]|uniref:Heavy metal tolerance protein n=1 Tax=[Torrubiella] hemipterigena TaxID=1531966 RepID=A0A0A1T9Z3_9HYPO|nr:hypothetical protein VHEMI03130 [[Torrubiella] hemipterigena]